MDLKKITLRICLILLTLGIGAYLFYPSETEEEFFVLTNKTQIQNKIKIDVVPSIKKIGPQQLIKFEIDIESFENADIINQELSETSFAIINSEIIKPTKWLPYQQSKYHSKGTLFFNQTESSSDNDSPSTITTNVLKLLIFDPEEREYTWTY